MLVSIRMSSTAGKKLGFFADAIVPDCAGADSRKQLAYSWTLYDGIEPCGSSSCTSVSKDNRYFNLRPYSLDALKTYTVEVEVSIPTDDGTNAPTSSASLTFQLGSSPVVASIDGGAEQKVTASDPFILDASSSYDVDYPETPSFLSYEWTCEGYSPDFGIDCGLAGVVNMASSTLSVPASALRSPGNMEDGITYSYNFSVLVISKPSAGRSTYTKSASAFTVVELTKNVIPRVLITGIQTKYNPKKKILLRGEIEADPSKSSVDAAWSNVGDVVDLTTIALTKPSITYTPVSASFVAIFELSIAVDSLAAGLYYTFELTAQYSIDKVAEPFSNPKLTSYSYK